MVLGPVRSTRALPGQSAIIATGGSCPSYWCTTSTMSPAFKWAIRKTVSLIWKRTGEHASAPTSWPLRESSNSSSFGFWLPLRIDNDERGSQVRPGCPERDAQPGVAVPQKTKNAWLKPGATKAYLLASHFSQV